MRSKDRQFIVRAQEKERARMFRGQLTPLRPKISRRNMSPSKRRELYITMRKILLSISGSESNYFCDFRKIQNRLSARRVRGKK
jgi:hypothetical protein